MDKYDVVIFGNTAGGLIAAALLADSGCSVCLIDRYCRSMVHEPRFRRWDSGVAAELHARSRHVEDAPTLLERIGLGDWGAPWTGDCWDRFDFPGIRFGDDTGLMQSEKKLQRMFPKSESNIRNYFAGVDRVLRSDGLWSSGSSARSPDRNNAYQFDGLTLQAVFDRLMLPPELQAILAAYALDLGAPPRQAGFAAFVGLSAASSSGVWVIDETMASMYRKVVNFVQSHRGCHVVDGGGFINFTAVDNLVSAALFSDGYGISADQFVVVGDQNDADRLINSIRAPSKRRNDRSGVSSFTVEITLTNLDLSSYGFGHANIWRYPSIDINACFERDVLSSDLKNPALFMAAPSIVHGKPATRLIVSTWCDRRYFERLRSDGLEQYRDAKQQVTQTILDIIESEYIPGLPDQIDAVQVVTPICNDSGFYGLGDICYGVLPAPVARQSPCRHERYGNLVCSGAPGRIPGLGSDVTRALQIDEILCPPPVSTVGETGAGGRAGIDHELADADGRRTASA